VAGLLGEDLLVIGGRGRNGKKKTKKKKKFKK
jgi:hypothetical protein